MQEKLLIHLKGTMKLLMYRGDVFNEVEIICSIDEDTTDEQLEEIVKKFKDDEVEDDRLRGTWWTEEINDMPKVSRLKTEYKIKPRPQPLEDD